MLVPSFKGSFSGSISAQNNLNIKFTDANQASYPSTFDGFSLVYDYGSSFNMIYDAASKQSASLSEVTGTYILSSSTSSAINGLTISGSSFTMGSGRCETTGTIAPDSAVKVFDISFDAPADACIGATPAGTNFKGILIQAHSSVLSGVVQIVATSNEGSNTGFYMYSSK
jgi:hypothetical protein